MRSRRPAPSFRAGLFVRTGLTLFTVCAMLATGCGRERKRPSPPPPIDERDVLPASIAAGMDTLPGRALQMSEITLPNGYSAEAFLLLMRSRQARSGTRAPSTGPQDAKNYLIALMAEEATTLSTRSLWARADEGADRPAQPNGLAYVYGGKNPLQRTKSASGCCPSLYGLDCSGFLACLFAHASVPVAQGPASAQCDPAQLTAALHANPDFTKLRAENIGLVPTGQMEGGDILYWVDSHNVVKHIGVVLWDQVYQSNGSDGTVNGACNDAECAKNQGTARGPRPIAVTSAYPYFLASGLHLGGVVRILTDISGTWTLSLRCESASYPVLAVDLDFPVTQNSEWVIDQSFTDYNGGALDGHFQFAYDKIKNELSGRFAISSPYCSENPFRTEEFLVRLNRDDTDYFATTQVQANDCSGCPAEIRLQDRVTGVTAAALLGAWHPRVAVSNHIGPDVAGAAVRARPAKRAIR